MCMQPVSNVHATTGSLVIAALVLAYGWWVGSLIERQQQDERQAAEFREQQQHFGVKLMQR